MSLESFSVDDQMEIPSEETIGVETGDGIIPAEKTVDDNGHKYRSSDGGRIPNNVYKLDGKLHKTDDYGNIYQVEGSYFPNDYFVVDGILYLTDSEGRLQLDDVPEDQQFSTELLEANQFDGDNPFAEIPEALRGMGEPDWEKLDDSGTPLWGYTNAEGTIDWYNSDGVYASPLPSQEISRGKDFAKGTPIEGSGGSWSGERGNSTWKPDPEYTPPPKKHTEKPYNNPDNLSWGEILDKYGIEGIEFNEGEPDFSPVARGEVQIDNFTTERHKKDANFDQAAEKLAEQRGCTSDEVKTWMKENNYTWHECSDCKTMQKVPNEIHANVHHDGGVSKAKEASEVNGVMGGGE